MQLLTRGDLGRRSPRTARADVLSPLSDVLPSGGGAHGHPCTFDAHGEAGTDQERWTRPWLAGGPYWTLICVHDVTVHTLSHSSESRGASASVLTMRKRKIRCYFHFIRVRGLASSPGGTLILVTRTWEGLGASWARPAVPLRGPLAGSQERAAGMGDGEADLHDCEMRGSLPLLRS